MNKKHGLYRSACAWIFMLALSPALLLAANETAPDIDGPAGLQVNSESGALIYQRKDLRIPGRGLSVELGFTYDSREAGTNHGYGNGWTSTYDLAWSAAEDGSISIRRGNGDTDIFSPQDGGYNPPVGVFDQLVQYAVGKYRLTTKLGIVYEFGEPAHRRLTAISDPNGNTIKIAYRDGLPWTLTEPGGRQIGFTFSGGLLSKITDDNAVPPRTIAFAYDADGNLTKITDPLGQSTDLGYDGRSFITEMVDSRDNLIAIGYTANGQVASVSSDIYQWNFTFQARKTLVKDGLGQTAQTLTFDDQRRVTRRQGRVDGFDERYTYDSANNVIVKTDALGQNTVYTFDGRGNRLTETDPLGHTATFSYEPVYNRLTGYTDKMGVGYLFGYDSHGNLISIQYPSGAVKKFGYDALGNQTSTTDSDGTVTTLTYNPLGDLTQITDDLATETRTYDKVGNLLTHTDGNGNKTSFSYDALNRLVAETNALGHTRYFAYDAAGNRIAETNFRGFTTETTYDSLNRVLEISAPGARKNSFGYDAHGDLVSHIDPNQNNFLFSFDAQGRLLSKKLVLSGNPDVGIVTVSPTGSLTGVSTATTGSGKGPAKAAVTQTLATYTYNPGGQIATLTTATGQVITYGYNPAGFPASILFPDGGQNTYTYNANGNPTSVGTPNGNLTTFTYDSQQRVTRVTDNLGVLFNYSYDFKGRVTNASDSMGNAVSYTYNSKNKPLTRTDARGNSASYTYDAASNLIAALDRNGVLTSYTYDAAKNKLSKTDGAGRTTSYTYDANGNVTSITDPKSQTTTYGYDSSDRNTLITFADGTTKQFAYDANDNITSRVDNNGATVNFGYDAQNKLILRDYPGNNDDLLAYDASGRLISAVNNNATVTLAYDSMGRLASETLNGLTTGYQYDVALGTSNTVYPSGKNIQFQYDGRARITEIRNGLAALATYTHDGIGNVTRQDLPQNGTYTLWNHDPNYLITDITHNPGAFADFNYTYDNEFRQRSEEKNHHPLHSQKYTYDNAYQLYITEEGLLQNGNIVSYTDFEIFDYDLGSNRTSSNHAGAVIYYAANNMNEYTAYGNAGGVVTPVHDNNGNLLSNGQHTFGYDFNNHMTSVDGGATATYLYDALGRRIRKTTPTSTVKYYYSGQQVIEERNGSNQLQASYVFAFGLDEVVSMERAGATYYYHRNALGSIVAVTNSSGNVVERYEYDGFGAVTISDASFNPRASSAIGNPYMFTGRRLETETGLYYYRARHYDSLTGRFLQRDPYGYHDSTNLYAYVLNDPINYVDPTGNFLGALAGAIVGAVVGGITAAVTGGNVVAGAVGGAVTGALVGSGVPPALAGAAGGAVSGAIAGSENGVGGAIAGAVVGAAAGAAAGAIAGGTASALAGEGFGAGAAAAFSEGAASTATTLGGALGEAAAAAAQPGGHAGNIITQAATLYYYDLPVAIYKAGSSIMTNHTNQIDALLHEIRNH